MEGSRFRFTLHEFAGAVADLGVMVPLLILLIVKNGMNPAAVLLLAGLLYIASGLVFRVPVPVQPLKAISIIAIASGLAPSVIAAAGILMGITPLPLRRPERCNGGDNRLLLCSCRTVLREIGPYPSCSSSPFESGHHARFYRH